MKLRTRGRWLIDEVGRTVLLRGVNFSGRHKQPPHTFATSKADLEPLLDLGVNVIRLVLVWEAIEPEREKFDEDYLDRVEQISSWAGELGIRVIMDMHQDIYSRAFGGSGAPEWTIPDAFASAKTACDDPSWFLRYGMSDAVRDCLARFWNDEDGIRGRFVASMVHAAKRLSSHPEVIGWEIYNEPAAGSLDVESFEERYLQAFYEEAIDAVRAVAPTWLCFYEGALFSSETGTQLDLSGREGMVYFPHFYVKAAHASRSYDGNTKEMDRAFDTFEADAARFDQPWMLGEYGTIVDSENAGRYLRDHEDGLASHRVGGTVWQYNPTELDWNDERMSLVMAKGPTPLVDVFRRPYPMAVAGVIERFGVDRETRVFSLVFTATVDADTIIFVPGRERVTLRAPVGTRLEVKIDPDV